MSVKDVQSMDELKLTEFRPEITNVQVVKYSPDGKLLAVGGYSDDVKVYDTKTWELVYTLSGHGANNYLVPTVAFSPDSRFLVVGSFQVKVWDMTNGGFVCDCIEHKPALVTGVFVTPDGRTVVSADAVGKIKYWEISSGRLTKSIDGHSAHVRVLELSPNKTTFASGGEDGKLRFWDLASGNMLFDIAADPYQVRGGTYTHEGARFVTVGYDYDENDKKLKIWNTSLGVFEKTAGTGDQSVEKLQVAPGGKYLVSGNYRLLVWTVDDFQLKWSLPDAGDRVAISPDGTQIALGASRTVKIAQSPWLELEQQQAQEKDKQRLEKLGKIMKVSDALTIQQLAKAMDLDEASIYTKIFDWAEEFGFRIAGEKVIFSGGRVDDFIDSMDDFFKENEAKTEKKEGKT